MLALSLLFTLFLLFTLNLLIFLYILMFRVARVGGFYCSKSRGKILKAENRNNGLHSDFLTSITQWWWCRGGGGGAGVVQLILNL